MTQISESKIEKAEPYTLPLHEDRVIELPQPKGYKILCAIPEVDDKYESGLAKADRTIEVEELLTTVLYVVKLGPDCYKDKEKFPSGAYCQEGDFVIVRPNAGTRVKVRGVEFRLIYDDAVEAVVVDPKGILRR